jgi:uncharacterized protein
MFRVYLGDLERRGTLQIHRSIPTDDGLWEGTDLVFGEPVEVDLTLTLTATKQVVARGQLATVLRSACRRCLVEVDRPFALSLELLWTPPDELVEEGADSDGFRVLQATAQEVDVGEAIREEIVLGAPVYLLCREGCRGLCPRCGRDLNEGDCDCARAEPDPRWATLRAHEKE